MGYSMTSFTWYTHWPALHGILTDQLYMRYSLTSFTWDTHWPALHEILTDQLYMRYSLTSFTWDTHWPALHGILTDQLYMEYYLMITVSSLASVSLSKGIKSMSISFPSLAFFIFFRPLYCFISTCLEIGWFWIISLVNCSWIIYILF